MRRKSLMILGAAVLAVAGLSAQGKPNFAGTWTQAPAEGAAAGAGLCGASCTITQDDKALTVVRGETKTVFSLDGSESSNAAGMSKAAWDGDKLTITTSSQVNGAAVETKTVLSIGDGVLTIESTGPGGVSMKQTYKKG